MYKAPAQPQAKPAAVAKPTVVPSTDASPRRRTEGDGALSRLVRRLTRPLVVVVAIVAPVLAFAGPPMGQTKIEVVQEVIAQGDQVRVAVEVNCTAKLPSAREVKGYRLWRTGPTKEALVAGVWTREPHAPIYRGRRYAFEPENAPLALGVYRFAAKQLEATVRVVGADDPALRTQGAIGVACQRYLREPMEGCMPEPSGLRIAVKDSAKAGKRYLVGLRKRGEPYAADGWFEVGPDHGFAHAKSGPWIVGIRRADVPGSPLCEVDAVITRKCEGFPQASPDTRSVGLIGMPRRAAPSGHLQLHCVKDEVSLIDGLGL